MLSKEQAEAYLLEANPEVIPKAWTQYKDLYLFCIEYPMQKINYDPFFSVDSNTGEVQDFSILEDLDTIFNLKWNKI
jgi:hypothetical protein